MIQSILIALGILSQPIPPADPQCQNVPEMVELANYYRAKDYEDSMFDFVVHYEYKYGKLDDYAIAATAPYLTQTWAYLPDENPQLTKLDLLLACNANMQSKKDGKTMIDSIRMISNFRNSTVITVDRFKPAFREPQRMAQSRREWNRHRPLLNIQALFN